MQTTLKLLIICPIRTVVSFNTFNQSTEFTIKYFLIASMFGLPLNIERSVQRANSSNVITQLRNIAAVSIKLGAFDKEIWRFRFNILIKVIIFNLKLT